MLDLIFLPAGFILVVVALSIYRNNSRGTGGSTLVLRKFNLNLAKEAKINLHVVGRPSGLISWILTITGLDSETSFLLMKKNITYKTSGLSGEVTNLVPLKNISSVQCSYIKPIHYLFFSGLFLVNGFYYTIKSSGTSALIFLVVFLALAGLCLLAYILQKTLQIKIETGGGNYITISFKKSIIENKSIDFEMVKKAVQLINQRVLLAHKTDS